MSNQFMSIPVPTYTWKYVNGEFKLIGFNKAAEALTQGRVANFVGKTAKVMYHDQPEIQEDLERCLKAQDIFKHEMSYQFTDAEQKNLNVTYVFMPPDLVIVHTEDITQRKQMEAALRQSEEQYRLLFNSGRDAIFVHEISTEGQPGKFIEVNTIACEWLGYTREELLEKSPLDINNPDEKVDDHLLEAKLLTEQHALFKRELITKDGRLISTELNVQLLEFYGKPAVLAIARDITKRKQTEEALKESEERYRSLFDDAPVSLWEEDFSVVKRYLDQLQQDGVTDFRTYFDEHPEVVPHCVSLVKVVDINDTTLKMYKAGNKGEFLNKLDQIFTEESYEVFKEEILALLAGKTVYEKDNHTQMLTGEKFHMVLRLTLAPGYKDDWGKVFVSILDITDQKQAEMALQESEARYRSLFEDAPIALWEEDFTAVKQHVTQLQGKGVTDFRGYFDEHPEEVAHCLELVNVLDVNQAALKLYGAKGKEDLFGTPSRLIYTKESYDWFKEGLITLTEGHILFQTESTRRTLTEDLINISLQWSIAPGFEKSWAKVFISSLNITERKRMETALRESEEKFRLLSEQSLLGIAILQDNVIKYVNQATADLFDYTIEEMLNWKPNEFAKHIHPDDRPFAMEQARKKQAGENEVATHYSYRVYTKSREIQWIDQYSKTVMYEGRSADLISFINITERKQTELALQERENFLRLIVENVTDVIFTTDLELNLTYLSPSITQLLGYQVDEIMSHMTVKDLMTSEAYEVTKQTMAEELALEKLEEKDLTRYRTLELEQIRKGGTTVSTEVKVGWLRNPDGLGIGFIGISRDISERKQVETLRSSLIRTKKYLEWRSLLDAKLMSEIGLFAIYSGPAGPSLIFNQSSLTETEASILTYRSFTALLTGIDYRGVKQTKYAGTIEIPDSKYFALAFYRAIEGYPEEIQQDPRLKSTVITFMLVMRKQIMALILQMFLPIEEFLAAETLKWNTLVGITDTELIKLHAKLRDFLLTTIETQQNELLDELSG